MYTRAGVWRALLLGALLGGVTPLGLLGALPDEGRAWRPFRCLPETHPADNGSVCNETPWQDIAVPAEFRMADLHDYSDVAVLINNKSETSRSIGEGFIAAQSITPEQVFRFDLDGAPTGKTINQTQFDDCFLKPFKDNLTTMNSTGGLNVLVTTKGVSLRVSGSNCGSYGASTCASFDTEITFAGGV